MIGRPLENITYPVYPLRAYNNITDINGVVKIYTQYKMYIIDDRNLEGKTLGERRLRLKNFKYPLRASVNAAKDVILGTSKIFIDDEGTIFKYIKTKKAKLRYKSIEQLIKLPFGSTKIIIRGITMPFIMTANVTSEYSYAGVLYIKGGGCILYEVSKKKKNDSWRKI